MRGERNTHTKQGGKSNYHIALAGWALYTSMGGKHLTGAQWTALAPHKDGGDEAEEALQLQVKDHHFIQRLIVDHTEATMLTVPETQNSFQQKYDVLYYLAWRRYRHALHNEVSSLAMQSDLPNLSIDHDPNKTTLCAFNESVDHDPQIDR